MRGKLQKVERSAVCQFFSASQSRQMDAADHGDADKGLSDSGTLDLSNLSE